VVARRALGALKICAETVAAGRDSAQTLVQQCELLPMMSGPDPDLRTGAVRPAMDVQSTHPAWRHSRVTLGVRSAS
jgi:hypothetical protein